MLSFWSLGLVRSQAICCEKLIEPTLGLQKFVELVDHLVELEPSSWSSALTKTLFLSLYSGAGVRLTQSKSKHATYYIDQSSNYVYMFF